MHWRTEAAGVAAADLCQPELDLGVVGPSFGAVPAQVDFPGLKVLNMSVWALVEEAVLAPAGLSRGHAGPVCLSSPVGRNGLSYAALAQVASADCRRRAATRSCQNGVGYTFLEDFPKSYWV